MGSAYVRLTYNLVALRFVKVAMVIKRRAIRQIVVCSGCCLLNSLVGSFSYDFDF